MTEHVTLRRKVKRLARLASEARDWAQDEDTPVSVAVGELADAALDVTTELYADQGYIKPGDPRRAKGEGP